MGSYLRLITPGVPALGAFMFPGIYKFPAYRFECDGVFTNKVPTDAYRGAGRPEATFAIERIMDELAVEDRKSTRLNSSHANISYAVFCLKKKLDHMRSRRPIELLRDVEETEPDAHTDDRTTKAVEQGGGEGHQVLDTDGQAVP